MQEYETPISPDEVKEKFPGTYDDIIDMPNDWRGEPYPMVMTDKGVLRFRINPVVRWLLDRASDGIKTNMNHIWMKGFDREDMMEFYRLIGYSLCGFSDAFGEYLDELAGEEDDE